MGRRLGFVLCVLGLVFAASLPALAQTPTYPPSTSTPEPTSTPSATESPTPEPTSAPHCNTFAASGAADATFARGERFFVEGSGLGRTGIDILLDNRVLIGSGRADRDTEKFSVAAEIPRNAAGGAHNVVAEGAGGRTSSCNINVSGGVGLPSTGSDIGVLSGWGATLLVVGIVLVYFAARRRRRRRLAIAGIGHVALPPADAGWTEADAIWPDDNR